jgi:hypothetical protein
VGVYIHLEVSSSVVGNEELNCSAIILLVHICQVLQYTYKITQLHNKYNSGVNYIAMWRINLAKQQYNSGVNYMTMFAQYMIRINSATQHILRVCIIWPCLHSIYVYLISKFPDCLVLFIAFLNTQLSYILTTNNKLWIYMYR